MEPTAQLIVQVWQRHHSRGLAEEPPESENSKAIRVMDSSEKKDNEWLKAQT